MHEGYTNFNARQGRVGPANREFAPPAPGPPERAGPLDIRAYPPRCNAEARAAAALPIIRPTTTSTIASTTAPPSTMGI